MSCFGGDLARLDAEDKKRHAEIEKQLKVERSRASRTFNVLVHGIRGSGRKTFLRHVRRGFSRSVDFSLVEIERCVFCLRRHVFSAAVTVLQFAKETSSEAPSDLEETVRFLEMSDGGFPNAELTGHLEKLLSSKYFQDAFGIFEKSDNATRSIVDYGTTNYHFKNFKRYSEPDFSPTLEDYLRMSQTFSSQQFDIKMEIDNTILSFNFAGDGGLARSSRMKYLSGFASIDIVVYLVDLTTYRRGANSLYSFQDNLSHFKTVAKARTLHFAKWVLVLNKFDLFVDCLSESPMEDFFPDFATFVDLKTSFLEKVSEQSRAAAYIRNKYEDVFQEVQPNAYDPLSCFVLDLLDLDQVDNLFNSIADLTKPDTIGPV